LGRGFVLGYDSLGLRPPGGIFGGVGIEKHPNGNEQRRHQTQNEAYGDPLRQCPCPFIRNIRVEPYS
jgi:hypothetical protein